MVKIQIGCAGWDYKDWIGPFYPKIIEKTRHLEYYCHYFNIVEINSSFYNLPSKETVKIWLKTVPQDFRFIVKFWQEITHKRDNLELESRITEFFYSFRYLEQKITAFLIQFPPWFKYSDNHLNKLNYILKEIHYNKKIKYVIEFRDNSWFKEDIIKTIIDSNEKILATTYIPNLSPYYFPCQAFSYIRLIGDREFTVFNRIQREQKEILLDLERQVNLLKNKPEIKEIFIIVNNHFAGFAPEMANRIKRLFGLITKEFNKQKSMDDFV